MLGKEQLLDLAKKALDVKGERNFHQSVELIITLRDIDLKKQPLNINEVVPLPFGPMNKPSICVIAGGDLAFRAKQIGVDRVITPDELDKIATNKKEAKKIAKNFDFFLAEAELMPKIGKILGPYLGPRGKMPTPLPPNAPIESIVERFKRSVRVRSKGQLAISCKIGDEGLTHEKIADNAMAVISTVERKLPMGMKNIRSLIVKTTMGQPVKLIV
ncbi:MAG: 50S ribosomal protein L1 [Nitrososphaerales archaeon]|nr:50S ribosomal protein L1 [Nitrososphaerales archaeon]